MAVPTYEAPVSFATVLAENFGCNWFRLMQDIVSKLLRATIWSSCAVLFESEQTPFSRAGRRFGSAALSRIRFRKCGFVPMSYFYSETNGWLGSKKIERSDGRCFGRQQHLANFIENFISREKKVTRIGPKFTKHKNLFDSRTVSVSQEWSRIACFPQASRSLPAVTASLPPTWKCPVFVPARLTRPSCAGARPQEFCNWLCCQNLWLSSGIAFGSDCQMTSRGLNLDSNLNSSAWPTGCKGFICSETPE